MITSGEFEPITILALHGRGHRGACYNDPKEIWETAGHSVINPDLTIFKAPDAPVEQEAPSFVSQAEEAFLAVEGCKRIMVVAHSRAGNVGPRVINRLVEAGYGEDVLGLAYFCPTIPFSAGQKELESKEPLKYYPAHEEMVMDLGDGITMFDRRKVKDIFYNEAPADKIAEAIAQLRPHDTKDAECPPLSHHPEIPTFVYFGWQDRLLRPQGIIYRAQEALTDAAIKGEHEWDHSPFYSDPEGFAEAIIKSAWQAQQKLEVETVNSVNMREKAQAKQVHISQTISDRQIQAAELIDLELQKQALAPPGVEPETAAMFEALLQRRNTPLWETIVEAADSRINKQGLKSSPAVSAIRSALVAYFRAAYKEKGMEFSDIGRINGRHWDEPMELLDEDAQRMDGDAWGGYLFNSAHRETSTSITSRYYIDDILIQAVEERWPEGSEVLDLGSSVAAGPLQMIHKAEFNMRLDRVIDTETGDDLTEKVNDLLLRPSTIRQVVGVDTQNIYFEGRQAYDSSIIDWAISCLRPSERASSYTDLITALTTKKVRLLQDKDGEPKLNPAYEQDSGLSIYRANPLVLEDLEKLKEEHPEGFNVILANYVTPGMSHADQIKLLKASLELLTEDGVMILKHPARLRPWNIRQPADIEHVRHHEHAHFPYGHTMHLVDMLHPAGTGVQEAMHFFDNRCLDIRLGLGSLVVNGELVPISDLIRNS